MIARAESGQARDGMTEFDAAEIARGVGELYEPLADDKGIEARGRGAGAGPGARQPRARQPGARQSGRQRDQVRRARRRRRERRRRPRSWSRRRARATASCSRSRTAAAAFPQADRGRAVERFVRLEQSRSRTGLRAGAEPRGGGRAPARRRAQARGQRRPACKTVISLPRARPGSGASRPNNHFARRRLSQARWRYAIAMEVGIRSG